MTFNLHVPADGWVSEEMHSRANSLIDSNISDVGSTIMPSTREFDISPSTGTIAPQGELDIKVHVIRTFLYIKYQSSSCYLGCPLEGVVERSTIFSVDGLHHAWIHTGFLCFLSDFQNDSETPRNGDYGSSNEKQFLRNMALDPSRSS